MSDGNTLGLLSSGNLAPTGRFRDLVVEQEVHILEDARELIEMSAFTLFHLVTPLCGRIMKIRDMGCE